MELFAHDLVVSYIRIALFVPFGNAKRIHSDRLFHGFALNTGCSATYRFDSGKTLTCHSGQCIYLPKGSSYTVETISKSDFSEPSNNIGTYAINFLLLNDNGPYTPFTLPIRGKDSILSHFSKAEAVWRQKPVGFQEACFSHLYQLINFFRKELASYSRLDGILAKLSPALHYIESNYTTETISLPYLAQLCSMSQPHMRKLFNSAFSVSPSVYIRNMRLNYAKELLRTGEYSVTSVALMAGFNNTTYFAREFKRATGVPPNKYNQ